MRSKLRTMQWVAVMVGLVLVPGIVMAGGSAEGGAGESASATSGGGSDHVELSWYMPVAGANADYESVMAEVNGILNERVNATLNIEFLDWARWNDRMSVMIAASEEFDMAFSTGWTNNLVQNVSRGAFIPLDDLLAEHGEDILADVPEKYWNAVTFDGQIYAVLNYVGYVQPRGLTFRSDIVEKYDIDYRNVTSLADLAPVLEQIKNGEPQMTPLLGTSILDVDSGRTKITSALFYDEEADEVVPFTQYALNDATWMENLELVREFYENGYIRKDAATIEDPFAEFKTGRYAVFASTDGVLDEGQKHTAMWGIPVYESVVGPISPISTELVQQAATAVSRTSQNPDRAVMVLNEVFGDAYVFNTLLWGLEGQNYDVVAGEGTDTPTIETKPDTGWMVWSTWIGNTFDSWPSNINSAEILTQLESFNTEYPESDLLGFTFDSEEFKNEVAQTNAIFEEAMGQGGVLTSGVHPDPEEYLRELDARLENAGIDRLAEAATRQINEWRQQNR